jgi:hypothetical protein
MDAVHQSLSELVAARMCEAQIELTTRWLERIADRVRVPSEHIFPTDELLDHMPLLIEGIAAHIRDPEVPVSGNGSVADRARELGALRYVQGFSEHQLTRAAARSPSRRRWSARAGSFTASRSFSRSRPAGTSST